MGLEFCGIGAKGKFMHEKDSTQNKPTKQIDAWKQIWTLLFFLIATWYRTRILGHLKGPDLIFATEVHHSLHKLLHLEISSLIQRGCAFSDQQRCILVCSKCSFPFFT